VNLIESASEKEQGSTSATRFNNPLVLIDEFFSGLTVDQNLLNLVLDSVDEQVISGDQFSGFTDTHDINVHFAQNKTNVDDLAHPSRGDYKLPHLNF